MKKIYCSIAQSFKKHLPPHLKQIEKFRSLIIKDGKKARANSFFLQILKLLSKFSKTKNSEKQKIKKKTSLQILEDVIFTLSPGFILRRVYRSGKLYNLPVPITPNHNSFLALNWLKKAVLKISKKSKLSIPFLYIEEIKKALKKQGDAYSLLKEYINIAKDQIPFSRFIRTRKKILSKSKMFSPSI